MMAQILARRPLKKARATDFMNIRLTPHAHSMRTVFHGVCALLAVITLVQPQMALADILIVRSSGPSAATYTVGKKLADTATITLKRGDRVTVLTDAGTRVLTGPVAVRLNKATPERSTKVRGLVSTLRGSRFSRAGAVRGVASGVGSDAASNSGSRPAGASFRPTSLWFADADKGGTVCLADRARLTLFRSQTSEVGRMRLEPEAGGEAYLVFVPRGVNEVQWPRVRPAAGSRWIYRPDWQTSLGSEPVRFAIQRIAVVEDDPVALAQALLAAGCQSQLEYMTEILADKADEPEAEAAE